MTYKNYNLPTLSGIISNDYLFFEGVSRPQEFYLLRDGNNNRNDMGIDILVMEKYFNDLYNLFLRKICDFATRSKYSDEESLKLQALLQEMIKVKNLIDNQTDLHIM